MSLLPIFEWCETTVVGQTIRDSLWLFPVIEALHLVAFAVLGGTVLLVNLRILGAAFPSEPVARLARDARPWQSGSLAVALASGSLLFLSEPRKLYYSGPFWVKMTCLVLAILFTFTVHRKLTMADERRVGPFWRRLAALVSIALWGGVAWGGRWIGFSG
jgi:hypothetical protein